MMPFAPLSAARDAQAEQQALLARLVRGDAAALDTLYRRGSAAVYRYALALSGNAAWAADAMQDAFVEFAARPEGYDPARGASLGAYLAGMARHGLLARWREGSRHDPLDDDDDDAGGGEPQLAPSPEALLVRVQSQQQLWNALARLVWPFREAVVLVDLQERSYAEAAGIAGVETNTLRTRLHRGRARLAALLNAGDAAP